MERLRGLAGRVPGKQIDECARHEARDALDYAWPQASIERSIVDVTDELRDLLRLACWAAHVALSVTVGFGRFASAVVNPIS